MVTSTELLRLSQWLNPAFPVGAFSYSHGMESAIAERTVHDDASAEAWIRDILIAGGLRNDAILVSLAARATEPGPVAELARALAASAERLKETEQQGAAFARTQRGLGLSLADAPYPVAFGAALAQTGLPLAPALSLFLQAGVTSLTSVAIRLVPIGQTAGQAILTALAGDMTVIAQMAETACEDDIGSGAVLGDIAAMRHETLQPRLFQT